jgi:hypothetical protein
MTSTADQASLYYLAHQLRESGDFAAAMRAYRDYLDSLPAGAVGGPTVRKALLGQVYCANALLDWPQMEALSRRVVELYPEEPQGPHYLGEALIRLERRSEAVAALEAAVALDPANSGARALLQVARAREDKAKPARRPRTWPPRASRFADLKHLLRRYLLDGLPDGLDIDPRHPLMTLGSCFAENLAQRLLALGFRVHHELIGEEVNTTYANRYLLEWVEHGPTSAPTRAMEQVYGPELRTRLADGIGSSSVFILTFGVAPCFFDDDTGEFVFSWGESSIAKDYLYERCSMRTTTVAENVHNIRCIIESLRRLSGRDPAIVVTVSPVPLSGTTELSSAIIADCISKSTLRLACHEVLSGGAGPRVHYWPSFEIVRWIGPHLGPEHPPAYGADDGNSRHVSSWLVDTVVDLFLEQHAATDLATRKKARGRG